ncbi:GPN-loop GTPase 2 [Perkinsus olseni]|uniref:GPN-loop GTPase 3 n=1 Tax=Perkinsus olseni TaxID=32597 RepID=A0A7J6RZ34_PEROL|nr:GPN-loop GTPase 2 [Perkinsus olseni]
MLTPASSFQARGGNDVGGMLASDSGMEGADRLHIALFAVRELVKVDDIAEEHQLGPNGAMVFAMQDLEVNSAWLVDRIEASPVDDYILFDCPGQIELYTHLTVMPHLVQLLTDKRGLDMRLTALNLTDCSVLASEGGSIGHIARIK